MRPGFALVPLLPLRPGGLAVLSFLALTIAGVPLSALDAPASANRASYAWLQMRFTEVPDNGCDPRHAAWIRASNDPAGGWTCDEHKDLNLRWDS